MVFNSGVLVAFATVWLIGITAWILYREFVFRRFLAKTAKTEIRTLLEQILKTLDYSDQRIKGFENTLETIRKKDIRHIQRVSIVRYNPFRDAGGNQSFTLAMLNEENSGLILTGLHARETTRLYIKDIHRGTSKHELSREERQALEQATKN